jgi:ferritin-like metal-binding protein YciE
VFEEFAFLLIEEFAMTLHELLVEEIKDLYHAEKQLLKALPKMAKAATHDDLREGFETHLEETREHVTRLEEVFAALDETAKAKNCPGMAGIIEEGSELMQEDAEASVMDAGLIAAAQRVEHYEIGAYGTCIAWAKLMGHDDVVSLLEQTLAEEKATDKMLTALAEQEINQAAMAESGEENMEEEEVSSSARGSVRKTTTAGGRRTRAKAADTRRRR